MNAQPKLTSADLNRGTAAASQELQEARADHAKCAYNHAIDRNDEAARQALIKSKQRMDLLEAELQGLSAATGEAKRRERVQALKGQIAQLDAQRDEAIAAANKTQTAFGVAVKAIAGLGEAYKALQAAELDANKREGECASLPAGHMFYPASLKTRPYFDSLLWLAIGDGHEISRSELAMNAGGATTPELPEELIAKYAERAKDNVRNGIRKKAAALAEELEQLEKLA